MAQRKYRNYKEFSANYLGGWTFSHGDEILTIKDVTFADVRMKDGSTEEKCHVWFKEYDLPLLINSTNNEAITKVAGSPDFDDWIGVRVEVGTRKVPAFGDVWDAVRISPEKPQELRCEDCGQVIQAPPGGTVKQLIAMTRRDFGRALCTDCARKAKAERDV